MPRRKKEVVEENVTPMVEDAINPPVEEAKAPVFKKIQCNASKVNVRAEANGEVMFTVDNNTKVLVEDQKDGWCKITGYVMAELVKDIK